MALLTQHPSDEEMKALATYGAGLLKMFHYEYEIDSTSAATEFRRGHVSEWRHLLDFLYGRRITQSIVEAASEESSLTIPPAGQLSDDGEGYLGFDSGAHLFIGRVHP